MQECCPCPAAYRLSPMSCERSSHCWRSWDSDAPFEILIPISGRRCRTSDSICGSRSSLFAIVAMLPRTFAARRVRSEEHTSALQSLMRLSYAAFCLKQKNIELTQLLQSHFT